MRKFLLSLLFFLLTPTLLALCLVLFAYSDHKTSVLGISTKATDKPYAFAALPTGDKIFEGSATLTDKRPINLTNYLSQYQSPLAPYANELVNKADEYGIDYRLLTAIAMQETGLCKTAQAKSPYNCWGFGIWGKNVKTFTSYSEAIDTISKYFGNKHEKGIDTLDAIGKIYNPNNTNNWTGHVAYVMAQL